MAQRINEEIRFYQPADPYYYQVDNLPLEDLLNNDILLQDQIDAIQANTQNSIFRDGFLELRPFINQALPGTVSVHPGNFIGRVQRSSSEGLTGSTAREKDYAGLYEVGTPPTEDNNYNVDNPPNSVSIPTSPAKYVGRTSVFNFMGGNITIDAFDFNAFQRVTNYTTGGEGGDLTDPPLGRIDLIGITTANGAMDDPYLPGNQNPGSIAVGDGLPKLAVLKGAGMVIGAKDNREVVIGEKYISVGAPQSVLNDYGRDLQGNVVPNPTFGTVPSPDDVINASFASDEVTNTLLEYADNNANASFFLPLAYVYVPQSHVEGNPIPGDYLKDIRPFFRTAELAIAERQALACSVNPSFDNCMVTESHLDEIFVNEVNRSSWLAPVQDQIVSLKDTLGAVTIPRTVHLNVLYKFKSGFAGNNSEYTITDAIFPEHQDKEITSVCIYVRPYSWTGDINKGWVGLKLGGPNGSAMYLVNWGNDVAHSSRILAAPGTAWVSPQTDGNGRFTITTAQSGTNQQCYFYVAGYTWQEEIPIG